MMKSVLTGTPTREIRKARRKELCLDILGARAAFLRSIDSSQQLCLTNQLDLSLSRLILARALGDSDSDSEERPSCTARLLSSGPVPSCQPTQNWGAYTRLSGWLTSPCLQWMYYTAAIASLVPQL